MINVREHIDFKRHIEPKTAMGHLQKDFIQWLIELRSANGVGAINIRKFAKVVWLEVSYYGDNFEDCIKQFPKDTFTKIQIHHHQKSWRREYHLWVNPIYYDYITNSFNKEGYIKESFQRKVEPKDAMGTGSLDSQMIFALDKRAKKYDFEKVPYTEEDSKFIVDQCSTCGVDPDFIVQKWQRDDQWIMLTRDSDDKYWIAHTSTTGRRTDMMRVSLWIKGSSWLRNFGEPLHESHEFKRHMEPKDAMQTGAHTPEYLKIQEQIKRVSRELEHIRKVQEQTREYKKTAESSYMEWKCKQLLDDYRNVEFELIRELSKLEDQLRALKESIDFKRGMDPKEAMGTDDEIYREYKETIDTINKTAKEYGFKIVPITQKDLDIVAATCKEEEREADDVDTTIQKWQKSENEWLILEVETDTHCLWIIHMYEGAPKYELSFATDWTEEEFMWEAYYKKPLKESIDFKRGLEPKDAMNIIDPIDTIKDKAMNFFKSHHYSSLKYTTLKFAEYHEMDGDMYEVECCSKMYSYWIGYNTLTKKYYMGYGSSSDKNIIFDQNFYENFDAAAYDLHCLILEHR